MKRRQLAGATFSDHLIAPLQGATDSGDRLPRAGESECAAPTFLALGFRQSGSVRAASSGLRIFPSMAPASRRRSIFLSPTGVKGVETRRPAGASRLRGSDAGEVGMGRFAQITV